MNILLTTETYLPWITGVSISTDNIARYLTSKGHRVTIVCPKQIVKGDPPKIENCEVIHVPSFPFATVNLRAIAIFPLALIKMWRVWKTHKFDIVHIQEPGETGVSALIMAKRYKVPVVGYLHFIPEQLDRVLWKTSERVLTPIINIYVRFIYDKYNVVATPSYFFKNYLKFLGVKTPVEVISNGVETEKFIPRPINTNFRKKYGIDQNAVLCFFLGRQDGDKNVGTLVRAMKFVKNNVHLLIIGKGKLSSYNHYLAKTWGSEKKITWIEYISNEEMANAYNASDVFTIMSPYEGQSIVALQAAASGLPIIAASAGALPEICRDNENGFLVNTYDYKMLAEKMNILAADKKLREKFGKESRRISLLHERSKGFRQLESQYEKLIKAKAP